MPQAFYKSLLIVCNGLLANPSVPGSIVSFKVRRGKENPHKHDHGQDSEVRERQGRDTCMIAIAFIVLAIPAHLTLIYYALPY